MKISLSKAEALKKIEKNLNKNNIVVPEFFYFTKKNFSKNKDKILNTINSKFNKKIIIRSSTYDEDTSAKSNAGKYLSLVVCHDQNPEVLKEIRKKLNKLDIKVVDKKSGEVVRQIPSETLIQLAESIQKHQRDFFNLG